MRKGKVAISLVAAAAIQNGISDIPEFSGYRICQQRTAPCHTLYTGAVRCFWFFPLPLPVKHPGERRKPLYSIF